MHKTICLLYHRINQLDDDIYNICVTPEHFEEQMSFLSGQFNVLRFSDDWESNNNLSVVVTFDDGYADNYYYAFPILKKYHIPATIFVSTENIGTNREFWWDEILRHCIKNRAKEDHFELNDILFNYSWETKEYEQCLNLAMSIRYLLRRESSRIIRDRWLSQLRNWANNSVGDLHKSVVTEEQIREMVRSGLIDIGGHTETHMSLGAKSYKDQYYECYNSIKKLEQITQNTIKIFSYPFGGKGDYNADTFRVMEELGIIKAATTESKVSCENDYKYSIPRIKIKDCCLDDFKKLLKDG